MSSGGEREVQRVYIEQGLIFYCFFTAGINAGSINNIGSLLNQTVVAPNVSLSRTNLPADAQLSPNFAQTLMQQQLSPGRSAPFSPQPNQGKEETSLLPAVGRV